MPCCARLSGEVRQQRHQRNPRQRDPGSQDDQIISSELQELVVRRPAETPENVGPRLPEQTKQGKPGIVQVQHHVECHLAREPFTSSHDVTIDAIAFAVKSQCRIITFGGAGVTRL